MKVWFPISDLFNPPETVTLQETPFILAYSNIGYLRFANVKFNAKSQSLRDQEQSQPDNLATILTGCANLKAKFRW